MNCERLFVTKIMLIRTTQGPPVIFSMTSSKSMPFASFSNDSSYKTENVSAYTVL